MGEFSITHILLVAVIYVMFFGEKKLPELGKSIGATIRGFKQGLNEASDDTRIAKTQVAEKNIELSAPKDSTSVAIETLQKESSLKS